MLGDGLATVFAGLVGGPPIPPIQKTLPFLRLRAIIIPSLRVAALICHPNQLFSGRGIGVIQSVPNCVLGGASIVLYGMIASVGLRTLVENHVDFTKTGISASQP